MNRQDRLMNILMSVGISFLFLIAADRFLGLAGAPSEVDYNPAYPSDFSSRLKFVDHSYTYRANKMGIRYREIPFLKESADETRVAVIGDSFVEGQGVEEEQSFCSLLEQDYLAHGKKVYFINCGVSGAGPYEYAQLLYRIGLKYHPDKLIIAIYTNDLNDLQDFTPEQKAQWKRSLFGDYCPTVIIPPRAGFKRFFHDTFPRIYTLIRKVVIRVKKRSRFQVIDSAIHDAREQNMPEEKIDAWVKKLPTPAVKEIEENWVGEFRITGPLLSPEHWAECLDIATPEAQARWQFMAEILSDMIHECRRRHIDVRLVYEPHPYQYDPAYDTLPERLGMTVRKEWLSEESELEKKLSAFAAAEDVGFLDLTPYFREATSQNHEIYNFKIDPHWNARGHKLAAAAILKWFKETHFVDR